MTTHRYVTAVLQILIVNIASIRIIYNIINIKSLRLIKIIICCSFWPNVVEPIYARLVHMRVCTFTTNSRNNCIELHYVCKYIMSEWAQMCYKGQCNYNTLNIS